MKPILYGATEKTFKTQGLGVLSEAISCKVTEERNGSYELEMVYPQSGKRFKELLLSRIIKAVPAYRKDPEPFRIYYISKPFNGKVKVKAEHISYQLSYIPVKPFTASNVIEAMEYLKKNSAEDNPFTFWTSKETKAKMSFDVPTSCRALLGGTSGSILDTYLGEYEFNGYTVKLHDHRGVDKGVTIRYGKNLTDVKQEESIASTITGICPYWKSEDTGEVVTLPETTISSDKANNFPYKRTVPHDFTASFKEKPTEAQLREKAQAYVRQTGFGVPDVSIDVSFVMLSQFEGYKDIALLEAVNLCDTVSVYFEPLEISAKAKVIKTVYNVLNDTYDSITLGNAKNSLTKVIEDIKQDTDDKITEETSARKKAIAELIKKVEAGKGLYLTDKGQDGAHDWYLHDKPELADSQTIIRINDGGMIFSVDGGKTYNGISWDGDAILNKIYAIGIDATYITAGEINAELVKIKHLHMSDISNTDGTTLDVTINGINSEVSKKVGDDEIISKINQSAEEVSISADKIRFEGSTSFSSAIKSDSTVSGLSKSLTETTKSVSTLKQTADNISAEVSKKVGDNEIISKINQSAEQVNISADKIEFTGSATFTNAVNANSTVSAASKNASDAKAAAKSANNTIDSWSYGNNRTQIDGGNIATKTITAEQIAIGDFTNYATVNENDASTLLSDQTIVGSSTHGDWIENIDKTTGLQFIFVSQKYCINSFQKGDILKFDVNVWCYKAQQVTYGIWFYDGNKTYKTGVWNSADITAEGYFKPLSATLKVPTLSNDVKYYALAVEFKKYGSNSRNCIQKAKVTKISGRLQVGEGYIDSSGEFVIGPMKSIGENNADVEFKKAIFVDYGIETFAGNDGTTPYIDFHNEATDASNAKYDYTARMQNTANSWIEFYGLRSDGSSAPAACTLQAGQFRGSFVQSSDKRLKTEIQSLDSEKVAAELLKYRPVSYQYINGVDNNTHHGLIAQEAQEVATNWGLVDNRGEYLAINYMDLIADLISVVQAHEKILRGEQK